VFTHFQWGTFHLDEESASRTSDVPYFLESGDCASFDGQVVDLELAENSTLREVQSQLPDSRFLGNLPNTQIDLNRSMGAKALYLRLMSRTV
jgi:hypothetical protein